MYKNIIYDPKTPLEYFLAQKQNPWTQHIPESNYIKITPQTDMDHFPYRRFFRGQHECSEPHIHSRTAGWRPRQDNLYVRPPAELNPHPYSRLVHSYETPYIETKFQSGTSGEYPSFHPQYKKGGKVGYKHFPNISINNR